MNLTISDIRLDEVHIRCFGGNPEIMLYISLISKDKKKVGQIYMASQMGYSETIYNISDEMKLSLKSMINEIKLDLLKNYLTYDCTS